ncbi:MAG: polysaccharide biosynthesis tyrosine autokinase [Gemmatimonadaceae bacterium]
MSGNIIPLAPPSRTALTHPAPRQVPQQWGPPAPPTPPPTSTPKLQRYLSVLGRFKWLILLCTLLGTGAGVLATRFVQPQYVVDAQIFISSESPINENRGSGSGPGQANELLAADAWAPLFRTGAISDEVVRQLGLHISPGQKADSAILRDFSIDDRFRPGSYELRVDAAGKGYQLLADGQTALDAGVVGDSIGRQLGFLWRPDPRLLRPGRTVQFTVVQPREAAQQLNGRLTTTQQQNFLRLSLTGSDPELTKRTLEYWITRFVAVAKELKQKKLTEYANTQVENLVSAERDLRAAEMEYQQFRVGAITRPTENTAIGAGTSELQPTVTSSYFGQRQQLDDLRSQRQTLERILNSSRTRGRIADADAFQLTTIPEAARSAALAGALKELTDRRAELRGMQRVFTDSAPEMIDATNYIRRLETSVIPGLVTTMIAQIRNQEAVLEGRVNAAASELKTIPERSTREQQLARDVELRSQLASNLQMRAQAAQLAVESATPDINILDYPVAPLRPTKNTVPQILAAAVLGGLALGLLLAFLADKLDQRFRYPEQAKDELGLDILGAVPRLRAAARGQEDEEESQQVLESFRIVRLNVRHALDERGPIRLSVSSPAAGDGKSLVASNLAVSFAEAGHQVLLVDGDIRRGALHTAFGVPQRPGLADILAGGAARGEALRPTSHRNLTVLPCGRRSRQAPELLSSAGMSELLQQLQATYDVIIVDSPPLSAGVDAFAIGEAAGSMVIVLRAGRTNMRLAHAKLAELDRCPVFAMGAVLNSITPKGVYEYYSYGYGYAAEDEGADMDAGGGALASNPSGPALAAGDEDDETRG